MCRKEVLEREAGSQPAGAGPCRPAVAKSSVPKVRTLTRFMAPLLATLRQLYFKKKFSGAHLAGSVRGVCRS